MPSSLANNSPKYEATPNFTQWELEPNLTPLSSCKILYKTLQTLWDSPTTSTPHSKNPQAPTFRRELSMEVSPLSACTSLSRQNLLTSQRLSKISQQHNSVAALFNHPSGQTHRVSPQSWARVEISPVSSQRGICKRYPPLKHLQKLCAVPSCCCSFKYCFTLRSHAARQLPETYFKLRLSYQYNSEVCPCSDREKNLQESTKGIHHKRSCSDRRFEHLHGKNAHPPT